MSFKDMADAFKSLSRSFFGLADCMSFSDILIDFSNSSRKVPEICGIGLLIPTYGLVIFSFGFFLEIV